MFMKANGAVNPPRHFYLKADEFAEFDSYYLDI